MNQLVSFLTSREILVVYVISAITCILCLSIYFVEKQKNKRRLRYNTRELNRLVLEDEEEKLEKEPLQDEEPVMIEANIEERNEIETIPPVEVIEEVAPEEELQYTSIEPDQKTAKLELKKMKEELERLKEEQEETTPISEVEVVETPTEIEVLEESAPETLNIPLTHYEEEQEEAAIISVDELIKKSKELYDNNELSQYRDEGTEPISLQELVEKKVVKDEEWYDEPFIIENVVAEEEALEQEEKVVHQEALVLDDFNTLRVEEEKETPKFKSSPIISPIYGIERPVNEVSPAEMELENTANYDKLDEEIRKTNEFLMTLRELQKKLDN